jgi:spermidine synthase
MPFSIILLLFAIDLLLLIFFQWRETGPKQLKRIAPIGALFFISGFPALIYQIVWQRALFTIYGVNVESVAVVVAAFMLGLGLGSLCGGYVSARYPKHTILLFGVAELAIALFGINSLSLFHWAAKYTAGASLGHTVVFSLLLLLLPTMLMGATLPLLVTHLVRTSKDVGYSVATLYFVNTLGSAVACYFAAVFLMRTFGQSGSVSVAVCLNAFAGTVAYIYGRSRKRAETGQVEEPVAPTENAATMPMSMSSAILVVAVSGFVSLGFEILWFRVFSLATGGRAPAFALLLATFLAGVAAGGYVVERALKNAEIATIRKVLGSLLMFGGASGFLVAPITAWTVTRGHDLVLASPAYYLAAALIGAVLPLVCRLALPPNNLVGRGVSLLYLANIAGSTAGSLVVGFILMNFLSLRELSLVLGVVAALTGIAIQFSGTTVRSLRSSWTLVPVAVSLVVFAFGSSLYRNLYEKLIYRQQAKDLPAFARVVENRSGVITVSNDGTVFGGGMYDGMYNVDPIRDSNYIIRAYAIGALHPNPKHVLMIGLASGSWAQVVANHPQVESLDIVEINPGYLKLIPEYPVVASLLDNPKVRIIIDDGRRWLIANPDRNYDLIVMNTTFHWRDHSSALLSTDFLTLARSHLNQGGVLFYNTTDSPEVFVTGLKVFRYGVRVLNFLAVSDRPLELDRKNWESVLTQYQVNGKTVFDLKDPKQAQLLQAYLEAADNANRPNGRNRLFEREFSLARTIPPAKVITDDNMGTEWSYGFQGNVQAKH